MWLQKVLVLRFKEDWDFKVWQWLTSGPPWWPFHYLSGPNLLKSFYFPLPRHTVPHQRRLDYLSLFSVQRGPVPLSHIQCRNPESWPRQTHLSPSPHIRSPSLRRNGSYCPFWTPHCTSCYSNLDYLLSLFHKTDPSDLKPFDIWSQLVKWKLL